MRVRGASESGAAQADALDRAASHVTDHVRRSPLLDGGRARRLRIRGAPQERGRPGLARSQAASAVTDQARRAKFRLKSLSGERTERRHNARALCLESGGRGACELVHSVDFRCKPRDPKGASHNSNYAQRRRVRLSVRSKRPQFSVESLRPGGRQKGGPLPPGRDAAKGSGRARARSPVQGVGARPTHFPSAISAEIPCEIIASCTLRFASFALGCVAAWISFNFRIDTRV